MTEPTAVARTIATVRGRVDTARARLEATVLWRVWERMLEIEFIDRSVALAGKAFVSLFPLIIVVVAFLPTGLRNSVLSSLTHRLGFTGESLRQAKHAFTSAQQIRRATGILGLALTLFYVSSFTTALQRVYLRAWRRPAGRAVGPYVRGAMWFVGLITYMAILGAARSLLVGVIWTPVFIVIALVGSTALWWLTAYMMLLRQVRFRVLFPVGLVTGLSMALYGLSATVWMPNTLDRNTNQFGIFGVALSLVTWFSGAAICIVVGACAGPVLATESGVIGRLIRGRHEGVLVADAAPDLPAPIRAPRLADAFNDIEDESGPANPPTE